MLEIKLLGAPSIKPGGSDVRPPRGQKAWGLLAYLILSEIQRPSREHLAGLLFGEADDPLRSLRWNLSELRRAAGSDVLEPGSTTLQLPADSLVDVNVLTRGTPHEALALPGLGRELLEGMDFSASPAFEGWLIHERRRLIGAACAALHEAALDRLASGAAKDSLPLARRLVELDPYDENYQELLIRAYARSGDPRSAREQFERCRSLFRAELNREPAASLGRAAEEHPGAEEASVSVPLSMRHAASALIEAGEAAAAAGATDSALQSLRRAAVLAHDAPGGEELEAKALFSLGSTLVHGVRGRDEEAASILRRSGSLADQLGLSDLEAAALRELSYVDALAGRYARCERGLAEAARVAESERELAALESIRSMATGDRGAHGASSRHAARSVSLAQRSGDLQRAAFALTFAGRSQLLTGDLEGARESFQHALSIVSETDWLAFASWPEAWLAEVELMEGNADGARQRMEYAFALACEFRDPCWEGLAGRGLGLIEAHDGNIPAALRRLEDARQRASRTTDCYVWVEAYALEALARIAVASGSTRASSFVEDLHSLAARTGMTEMAARAFLYRSQLGDRSALDAARLMAAEVENPALVDEVNALGAGAGR